MGDADRDGLGRRMKEQYENHTRYMLPRRTWTIVRVHERVVGLAAVAREGVRRRHRCLARRQRAEDGVDRGLDRHRGVQCDALRAPRRADPRDVRRGVRWDEQPAHVQHGTVIRRTEAGWLADFAAPVFTSDRESVRRNLECGDAGGRSG